RIRIVGNDTDFPQIDADPSQVLGNVADILVFGPSRQDLVADHQEAGGDDSGRRVVFHRVVRLFADAAAGLLPATPIGFGASIDRSSACPQPRHSQPGWNAAISGDRGPGGSTGPGSWSRTSGLRRGYETAALPGVDAAAYKSHMDAIARGPEPPPYRPIAFAPVDVICHPTAGGGFQLHSRTPLGQHDPSLGRMFRAAVEAQADRVFLAERSAHGWRALSYAASRSIADGIAAAFLERGLSAERPVMVLSGNSIDHALLMLAAYTAGVPIAPISVAYSLQSRDH